MTGPIPGVAGVVIGLPPVRVPPGLMPGEVGVTPMSVPPGLMPGVVDVPPGLGIGVMPGLVVEPGLVPGPPGPNTGDEGEFEEEGEPEEEGGELEEAGWVELLLPPPQPAIVMNAHEIHREANRVDNHLAITAFRLDECAYLNDEG